jgi:hypothetical protein
MRETLNKGPRGLFYEPPVSTFPGFVPPCLPTKAKQPPSGVAWLHEIKHDGFRVIAWKDGKRLNSSRPGNDLTNRFPLIIEALASLCSRACVIDGEAVVCDEGWHPELRSHPVPQAHWERLPLRLRSDRVQRRRPAAISLGAGHPLALPGGNTREQSPWITRCFSNLRQIAPPNASWWKSC